MQVRVLGSVELAAQDGVVPLAAAMPRRLLAVLAIRAGAVCSRDALVDALWDESPPASAAKLVQVYVSQLRKALPEADRIRRRGTGYLLELADGELDAHEFERLLRAGRAAAADGSPARAASLLRRALSLWRGDAYAEFAGEPFARAEAARLEELRLACLEERFEAELALGRHAELLPELQALARLLPLRERLQAQTMLALYRCGRQSDALELYRRTRARMHDELGLEPGAELRELHRRILEQDASLDPSPRTVEPSERLPAPPNTLLGRERERTELGSLLLDEHVRLLVLAGAGGSGKTRLALEVARDAAAFFADGAVFVDLAPVRDPAVLVGTIAQALGIREASGDPVAALASALRPRELLLLLDNAEHLRSAAPLYVELLAQAPHLALLVTSRVVLHLTGEHVYPVEPLAADAAVALFLERAREGEPRFRPDAAAAEAIARICARLDGLPLAIELAASRIRTLTPAELLARLEQRLPLLTGGPRDLPTRQQTLSATLDWSYELLDEEDRRDFRRLAVFAGGCTLDAAADVCPTSLERLAALVDHSLLVRTTAGEGSRYSMLETIREYALARLEAGEAQPLRDRHARHFVELAERAFAARLEQLDLWLPLLEGEHANLRAALDWLSQTDPVQALRLAGALGWFWAFRGYLREGRRRLGDALARNPEPTSYRARALAMGAQLLNTQGDLDGALEWGEEGASIARALDDPELEAVALFVLSNVCTHRNDFDRARALCEEALTYARRTSNAALAMRALGGLCYVLVCARKPELAEPRAEDLLTRAREGGFGTLELFGLHYLGDCALLRGDWPAAEERYRLALAAAWRIGHSNQAETELIGLAIALAGQSRAREALRLAAAVDAHRSAEDVVPSVPFWEELRTSSIARARAELGPDAAEAAWAEGAQMTIGEAVEGALNGAFMEPSGRNRWQPVAKGTDGQTAHASRPATAGNPRQPPEL